MDNLFRVTIGNRIQNGLDDRCRVVFAVVSLGARRFGNYPIEEFPSGTQFRHQVQVLGVLKDVDQFDDVRVLDLLEDFNLAFQDLDLFDLCLSDGFDGVPLVCFAVHALSYNPIVAMTKFLLIHVVFDTNIRQSVCDLYGIVGI